jgi:hypothetical protein
MRSAFILFEGSSVCDLRQAADIVPFGDCFAMCARNDMQSAALGGQRLPSLKGIPHRVNAARYFSGV